MKMVMKIMMRIQCRSTGKKYSQENRNNRFEFDVFPRRSISVRIIKPLYPSYSPQLNRLIKVRVFFSLSIEKSFCSSEVSNDQLLWTPPLDANEEENSALVNKYLKLAAKECSSIFSFVYQSFQLHLFNSSNS